MGAGVRGGAAHVELGPFHHLRKVLLKTAGLDVEIADCVSARVKHIQAWALMDGLWAGTQPRLPLLRLPPLLNWLLLIQKQLLDLFWAFDENRANESILALRPFPSRKSKEAERGRGQSQEQTARLQRAKECVHG